MGTLEQESGLPHPMEPHDGGDRPGLPGTGGQDGFGGYGRTFLSGAVGRGQANEAEDVLKASSFLAENKLLPGPTKAADEGFFRAMEDGQRRLNDIAGGGLQVDGIAKPWGPTEVLSQRAVSSGKMKAPRGDMPPTSRPGPNGIVLRPDTPEEMLARLLSKNIEKQPATTFQRLTNVRRLPGGGLQGDLPPALRPDNGKTLSDNQTKSGLPPADTEAVLSALRNLGDNAILLLGQILRIGTPTVVTPTLENPERYFIKDAEKGA